jgi:hypothetical protein
MSVSQSDQNSVSRTPQPSLRESGATKERQHDEQSLIKLYMELTGENESHARGVLMFVLPDGEEVKTRNPDSTRPTFP